MEMDSTSRGRPFDRSSRDPAALKKPRLLTEETTFLRSSSNIPNGGGRPLVQRQPALGFRPTTERDRDSESSDPARGGGGYQPQSLSQSQLQQQQHHELVSQYRTALAELTFNSKPIITNLTIIAGENLHAAKSVAATICTNILEVPSDQKLPSLYLLDSIVKNIGRDYIKYFAARLPEVFCKAYRQVDSAVHSAMRHLFGTWKGVFPLQSLQVIEEELGFQQAANGSSSALTASRSEPQPQRPARSIHVNPKYLEARQRLQQSSTAKGPTSDTNLINSPEDAGRQDRTGASIGSVRPRADPRLKLNNIQQAQRDVESGCIRENDSAPYTDYDYGADVSNPSEGSFGKSSEIVAERGFDNFWYGPGNNSTTTISGQRNGFNIKQGLPNFSAPKSVNVDVKLQPRNEIESKRGSDLNRNWKNSDEEEYMWDDMNSRLAIPGKSGRSSKRDPRSHPEPEKLGFENLLQKPQDVGSRVDREASSDSLSTDQKDGAAFRQQIPSVRSQRLSFGDKIGTGPSHIGPHGLGSPPNATTGQQRHTVGAALPAHHSSRIPHGLAGQDQTTDGKPARSRGQKNTGIPNQSPQDSFHKIPQNPNMGNSQKLQMRNLQTSSHQLPLNSKKHAPILQPLNPGTVSEPSLDSSESPVADVPAPSTTGNLLAAVSSIFGNKSVSGGILQLSSQIGPPVTQFTSSASRVVSSRITPSSHDSVLLSDKPPPPLPPATSTQTSSPVSSLLSTLVAKGLISASKADSSSGEKPTKNQSRKIGPLPSSEAVPDSDAKVTVTVPQSTMADIKSVIGFEFKPDVIRRSHPVVISDLIDDLPHQCDICGLRFKLQERFDRHMEWHTMKKRELNTPFRRWFKNCDDWVKAGVMDCMEEAVEIDGEKMVTADENQCVCILCGELFDDFYSQEMNKWMFRRAVYLSIKDDESGNNGGATCGPIVHVHCISENSISDLGLSNGVKMEEGE